MGEFVQQSGMYALEGDDDIGLPAVLFRLSLKRLNGIQLDVFKASLPDQLHHG